MNALVAPPEPAVSTPPPGESTPTPPANPPAPATPAPAPAPSAPPPPAVAAPAEAVAPEVTIDVKLPQGVTLADADLASFKATAKELGLDSPKSQKLIDLYSGMQSAAAKAQAQEFAKAEENWVASLKSDPEIGGTNYPTSEKNARLAVEKFGGEPLKQLLVNAGLANHPALVRAFARIGKAMADDSVAGSSNTGGVGGDSPEADLARLYPSMFPSH